ncbi:MAG: hypothetical protein M1170_02935 [Patescibacteria group bacterium]|nr:hypothetical protein [Patescibacteria group bacterium]
MENNFIKIYANFLKKRIQPQKKLKVVFDCSNGAVGPTIKKLQITNPKLQIYLINEKPDGNFPGHGPDPWAKGAMEQLQKEVLRQKADLGVIFDADGDRVFFIDNLGCPVEPDIIARLLIWHLKPRKAVYDIRAGWLIKKLKIENLKLKTSRVGHFYIKKLMRKIGADLGVEKSGHYYFAIRNFDKGELYYDSGILAAIEIINAVSKLPYSLANFIDLLPQYYRSGEINIKSQILNLKSQKLFKEIERKLKIQNLKFKINVSHLDGLTMEFLDYWFNIRPSNTEPLIRLNMEAEDKKILEKKKKELIKLLKN